MDKSWLNRSWIHTSRISDQYETGVEYFIEYVIRNANDDMNGRFFCLCVNFCNATRLVLDVIREHLLCDGFLKNYTRWIWHGENVDIQSVSVETQTQTFTQGIDMDDRLEEMLRDVGLESFKHAQMYETMCNDLEKPLYPNCTKFTRLSGILRLFNLKARNGWSDKQFTELLELLKKMLPEGNTLPNRNYEAKKVLCAMGLEYKKIHAYPNDCMLYHGEFEGLHQCPKCELSRYRQKQDDSDYDVSTKGPPAKVLWYLPIFPRLKHLFANANGTKLMRWHEDERKCDGSLRHLADCATNGMNPFGNLSTKHSSWPVLLTIYNLPPWLCMKCKYLMLSMMISGPRQPGNDIDVYLSPLVEDLKMLWEEGIDVFDGYSSELFRLRAMLFCTINDFPTHGNLCGYNVKGHKAFPICEEETCYHQLLNWKKTIYLGHRRFLKPNHDPY
uniref:Transposase-associated domain-containing protein n=2 Tax=Cajanus cajan TaxID=3821 RepID=A0A151UG77_CAJCA